jgi:soluble lytic murein transglycosylase-like protein
MVLFTATSLHFNLPPGLLSSICYVETRHNVNAIHYQDGGEDSIGVCQLHYTTAQWLGYEGTEEGLLDPATNIYWAGAYLAYQQCRYHSIQRAVIAYNYGHAKGLTTTEYQVKVYRQWRPNE